MSSRVELILRPVSRPAHHSSWLLLVVFINSNQGDPFYAITTVFQWLSLIAIEVTPSYAITTGIGIGVDLEVIFQWLSLIAIEVIPLMLPPLKSELVEDACCNARPEWGYDIEVRGRGCQY